MAADGLPVQVSVNLCARDLLDAGLAEMVDAGGTGTACRGRADA